MSEKVASERFDWAPTAGLRLTRFPVTISPLSFTLSYSVWCVACRSTLPEGSFVLLQGVADLFSCYRALASFLRSPKTMSSSDSKPALWLRCETKPHEHRSVAKTLAHLRVRCSDLDFASSRSSLVDLPSPRRRLRSSSTLASTSPSSETLSESLTTPSSRRESLRFLQKTHRPATLTLIYNGPPPASAASSSLPTRGTPTAL